MTQDQKDKASQVADLTMEALKRLGVQAAVVAFDVGDSHDPDNTTIECNWGGLGDGVIVRLVTAVATRVMEEVAEQRGIEIPSDMRQAMHERLDLINTVVASERPKADSLQHLNEYAARIKLVRPL
jgi:hypothetical protein